MRANMVGHASDYPWSSYQGNAAGKPIELLTPHPMYQRLGRTDEERQGAYRALFRGRMSERDVVAIRDATNKAWVLGSDRFKAQIEAKTGRRPMPLGRGGDRKSAEFRKAGNQWHWPHSLIDAFIDALIQTVAKVVRRAKAESVGR